MDLVDEEAKINNLLQMKENWKYDNITFCGDKNIISFIGDVLFHGAKGVSAHDSIETIRCLFECGYCYYFAQMLSTSFPGGKICICYPYGHIVYVYDGVAYDIGGVTDAEYEMLLPCSLFGKNFEFKHAGGKGLSQDQIERIAMRARESGEFLIAMTDIPPCRHIADNCKIFCRDTNSELYLEFQQLCDSIEREVEHGTMSWIDATKYLINWCAQNQLDYQLIKRLQSGSSGYYERQIVPRPMHF